MIIVSETYSVNGFKYRNIEELRPIEPNGIRKEWDDIGLLVLTPNCAWVYVDTNPSFDCKKCNKDCYRYKQWEEFYSSL